MKSFELFGSSVRGEAAAESDVDFLRSREADRDLRNAAIRVSEQAFSRVWDNPDDAVCDQL